MDSLLEHLQKHKSMAFKLTVKSGYFHTLSEAVCAVIDRGMSFSRIEKIIKSDLSRNWNNSSLLQRQGFWISFSKIP